MGKNLKRNTLMIFSVLLASMLFIPGKAHAMNLAPRLSVSTAEKGKVKCTVADYNGIKEITVGIVDDDGNVIKEISIDDTKTVNREFGENEIPCSISFDINESDLDTTKEFTNFKIKVVDGTKSNGKDAGKILEETMGIAKNTSTDGYLKVDRSPRISISGTKGIDGQRYKGDAIITVKDFSKIKSIKILKKVDGKFENDDTAASVIKYKFLNKNSNDDLSNLDINEKDEDEVDKITNANVVLIQFRAKEEEASYMIEVEDSANRIRTREFSTKMDSVKGLTYNDNYIWSDNGFVEKVEYKMEIQRAPIISTDVKSSDRFTMKVKNASDVEAKQVQIERKETEKNKSTWKNVMTFNESAINDKGEMSGILINQIIKKAGNSANFRISSIGKNGTKMSRTIKMTRLSEAEAKKNDGEYFSVNNAPRLSCEVVSDRKIKLTLVDNSKVASIKVQLATSKSGKYDKELKNVTIDKNDKNATNYSITINLAEYNTINDNYELKVTAKDSSKAAYTYVEEFKVKCTKMGQEQPQEPEQPQPEQPQPEQPQDVAVTEVKLDKEQLTIGKGQTLTLNATVLPENATNKNVTWASSDDGIVSVKDGKIEALQAGEAEITVKTEDGGKTATCKVTVTEGQQNIAVEGIKLTENEVSIKVGESKILEAKITPEEATNKNVTWASSNDEIVSVKDGKIEALKEGEAEVTVKTEDGGKTATCKVTVTAEKKDIAVERIELDKTEISMKEKQEEQLVAIVKPEDATNKDIKYSSSDEGVATVDGNGKITAVKEGTATITVQSVENDKISATCKVTVEKETKAVEKIELNESKMTIEEGEEKDLVATVTPSDADNKDVNYSSSDEAIAKVDGNGKVTATKAGTATITVQSVENDKISATCKVTVKKPTITYKYDSEEKAAKIDVTTLKNAVEILVESSDGIKSVTVEKYVKGDFVDVTNKSIGLSNLTFSGKETDTKKTLKVSSKDISKFLTVKEGKTKFRITATSYNGTIAKKVLALTRLEKVVDKKSNTNFKKDAAPRFDLDVKKGSITAKDNVGIKSIEIMAKGALTHGNYNTEIVSKDYTKKPTEATLSFDLLKKTTPLDDGYIHLRIKIVDCNNMIHTELRKIKYETN